MEEREAHVVVDGREVVRVLAFRGEGDVALFIHAWDAARPSVPPPYDGDMWHEPVAVSWPPGAFRGGHQWLDPKQRPADRAWIRELALYRESTLPGAGDDDWSRARYAPLRTRGGPWAGLVLAELARATPK